MDKSSILLPTPVPPELDEVEHVIHKKDGTIGEKNSYGNHPRNIPG